AAALTHLGASIHQGDVTDRASLRAPMTGVDGVFHLAAWYKLGARARERQYAERINVEGTRNVLETMAELGIPRGVYTSTLAVFSDTHGWVGDEGYKHDGRGPWLSEYDRTKWKAHYEVALPLIARGLPLVIVQPGVVYGPDDPSPIGETLRRYGERRLPVVPRGTAYCWGHVDDTAGGHVLAMERGRPGESYIIAGPPHTLEEALEIAAETTGIAPPRLRSAPWALRAAAALAGVVERIVPLPATYSAETLRVAAGVTYLGSSEKAQRELGFTARPLAEGFRDLFAVRRATATDLPDIVALLEASKLPVAGIAAHIGDAVVARDGGALLGCAAVEIYGRAGLLRSVAVAPHRRGAGLGQRLTAAALERARHRGVREVYLLTTTAGDFFPRFGFTAITRAGLDPALAGSEELRGACPDSALAMRASL
ncbi:MAG: arsenic resistance N-acetyltransferase ArsN2, partial [Gemmatimonadales bacterium]